jgi:hypothetical protein
MAPHFAGKESAKAVPFQGPVVSERTRGQFSTPEETAMTETPSPALDTALAYYRAWTGHDFERAMSYIADDIVCDAPAGRIEGAEAFRGFMGPFTRILTNANLIAAFGDDRTALLMYETETVPVALAPGSECLTVQNGTITHLRIIFDRTSFDAARKASAS